ncbi:MAG: DUF1214 domain-containing protein [Deltaproteobacteria bacterium]|nr:DUF1214 domain-containing protein [Deltaproteobacteria bacterium]MBW2385422.1 DUF1214 domain-containing protein [Deltaproteobacteria bacterium]
MAIQSQSRAAMRELIALLQEIDEHWCSEERNLNTAEDVAGSHRALMHILEAGLVGYFEQDARTPSFRRIVTPSRKLTGDNSDAIYFDAPLDARYTYVVRGKMNQAVYFSMSIEEGAQEGHLAKTTGGVINDTEIDVDADGNFTVHLGGEPRKRNWLPLPENASRVTTRHYFELATPAAMDPAREPVMNIACISKAPTPAPPSDDSVSAGIRRVCNMVRSRTLDMPQLTSDEMPAFMAVTPNTFPEPQTPGNFGLAAADAHYSMAPFLLGPEEALVMTGRWPDCRFANVCLWNRFQQTFDYPYRSVSLNRTQTEADADGRFTMIVAHEDPGLPNWLDTEGNAFGLIFWRFFLVEGAVETPTAKVVNLADICST